jgi:long-chain acyl-CoA synthetase
MAASTARQAADSPGSVGLADSSRAIGWAELDAVLNRAVNALHARHLSGARIAVFAENRAETVIALTAGVLAGASVIPISHLLTVAELEYIVADARPALLFSGPATTARAAEAAATAGIPVVAWDASEAGPIMSWDRWLAIGGAHEPRADRPPQPFLHYTSGTTGRPKGVLTPPTIFGEAGTVTAHVERLRAASDGGTTMIVSPLHHAGSLGLLTRSLLAGDPLVILDRFDAEASLQTIERFGVNATMMVPTHFRRLLALPEATRHDYDLSTLRAIHHTGAACPVELKRAMIDWLGPILFEAYGATECGATNRITSAEWLERPGSVGRTVPPYELLIVDDDGRPLAPGCVGHIYFRDTTGRGIVYHNDPEKTAAAHLRPGVFTLGEVGYRDADGYLYITDRVSDMVLSGGVNVYPAEIEAVLVDHPAVGDAAVIGVPNEEMGEELKALVVPIDPDAPPSVDELRRLCRERLAGYKQPRSLEIVPDVGRNAMGKVDKRALRAPYWSDRRTIG